MYHFMSGLYAQLNHFYSMGRNFMRRLFAECLGTFWLVLGGCGAAVLAAGFPALGLGFLGVSLAFGLSLLTMAYAIGPISGCHINPAVTLGLAAAGRFPMRDVLGYIVAQCVGAILGAAVLYLIASGAVGFTLANGFAANGYGEHSPGGYTMQAAFICEFVMTMFFLIVILGSTDNRSPVSLAGIPIGLSLTLVHLVSIPVTNASVNPARSLAPALFVGDWAINQLWLFIVAPIIGAIVAGVIYRWLFSREVLVVKTTHSEFVATR
jgi:aquaporin Z